MVNNRIIRVSRVFDDELREFAKKNDFKLIDATTELAKMLRQNKNKRLIKKIEIKF